MAASSAEPSQDAFLRIGFLDVVDSLNPFLGYTEPSMFLYGLLYDGLMSMDEDFQVTPDLAKSWYAVPTTDPELVASGEPFGSVWQYNLTHNASWSDGEPFGAEDVVFTINLNAANFTYIWAYQPSSYFMKLAEAIDDYTVRIHFCDRAAGTPMAVSFGGSLFMPILPAHKLDGMSATEIGFYWSGIFANSSVPIVGTGPFVASMSIHDDWSNGRTIKLVANPDSHWTADYGRQSSLRGVNMTFYRSEDQLVSALKNGEVDIASLSREGFRSLESSMTPAGASTITLFSGASLDQKTMELSFNYEGPFNAHQVIRDPAVRQGMLMATDKEYVVNHFLLGLAIPGETRIPSSSAWHKDLQPSALMPFDLSRANATLVAAGYIDTDGDRIKECSNDSIAVSENWSQAGDELECVILAEKSTIEEQIAEFLQGEWRKVGVNVTIGLWDPSILPMLTYPFEYDHDLAFDEWWAPPEPNELLWPLTEAAFYGWNEAGYYNVSFEENYTQSVSALDQGTRRMYVGDCQSILYHDVASLVLAELNQTYAWRTDRLIGWGNWTANPGLSLGNSWSGAPLLFSLSLPEPGHHPSVPMYLVLGVIGAGVCAGAVVWAHLVRRPKVGNP